MSEATTDKSPSPSAPVVALAAWILPGAGYWLLGERSRGITIGVTILILFILGIFIGGVRIVEAPLGPGTLSQRIGDKPWFVPQVLTGPVAIAAAYATERCKQTPELKFISPHARIQEIPTLYTAVAGMLNLLAIIDASYKAGLREE